MKLHSVFSNERYEKKLVNTVDPMQTIARMYRKQRGDRYSTGCDTWLFRFHAATGCAKIHDM
jgi:hypothetical protein